MVFFLVLALILVIIAVIFAVQNTALVTIAFFSWNIEVSLALALLAALFAGVLITLLFALPGQVKSGWNSVSRKKKFSSLETERDSLKQQVATAAAESDSLKLKLGESEKEISRLEEQLASISAMLPDKDEVTDITTQTVVETQSMNQSIEENGLGQPGTENPA